MAVIFLTEETFLVVLRSSQALLAMVMAVL
jgi:hypothetical protein